MRRYAPSRESYIAKGSIKVADKLSDAVAYLSQYETSVTSALAHANGATGKTRYRAVIFFGKQNKPVSNFYYLTEASRNQKVAEAFAGRRASLALKTEIRASRNPIKLEIGHILETSWGYDQTNVEFYQVTKLIGSSMVEIREIGQVSSENGFMTGNCTPVLDKFVGEPIRCRLNESGVKVDRHYAHLWNGKPARWSSYA